MEKTSLLFILFLLLMEACENHTQDISEDKQNTIDGMIFVKGGTVTLGSNDSTYRAAERPAMEVKLDYDYYLDIHEVTCGEYRNLAKKKLVKDFGKCENDSLPLANVTYYDAILYANAKSKSEKRDSAYTHTKATFDSEGHCTNLEGFAFHPDVDAYRLPTEAEWVLAASKGWDPKNKRWNADNSDFKAHAVCSAGEDAQGFCDLAGNVKEWVNDWAGKFRDTSVTNYLGAPDGGDIGERILKGGYFSDRPSEMNVVARGDDYTVVASSRAERIGFRLAFGQIPSPTWLDASGHAKASIITPLAGTASLKSYTGTYNMVLAFRNDLSGNLAYIDYNDGNLSVVEIQDSLDAYHPDISPDGKRVAFCTKYEGISGNSALYVRDLDAKGSNLVKLNVKSAAIPRWRVLSNGDTAIVYVTDAGNNKDEAAFEKSSTWQVKFANGKFGTPEKLLDGAYHGGISEDNALAITGARLLRARIAKSGSTITETARDTVWYNGEQACNASLAQDGSKRTSFLDFASKTGKKFTNETYATHERIFIADSNGKLTQSIKSPEGYTFDHSEWASDGETSNIVATLTNANGAHTRIVLVSPTDNSIVELAEGEELWHPCLWIKKADNSHLDTDTTFFKLDPDSAGIYYNSSGASPNDIYYRYKMELLWQYRDSINVVILGSSRALRGVNPNNFSKPIFAINMAVAATIIDAQNFLFYNYVLPHCKNLKTVIISIDPDRGGNTGNNSNNMFHEAYKSYPGYVYDMNHNFWKDYFPPNLASLTYDSPGSQEMAKKLRPVKGFHSTGTHGWGEPVITGDSCWMDKKESIYRTNFNMFVELLKTCKENNINVIGVIFPTNPKYAETGAYGYAGLRRSEAPALIQELADLHKTFPNFTLMDENKMGNHDYTDDMANDYSHLSTTGAQQLTHRLDSLIQTLDINFSNK